MFKKKKVFVLFLFGALHNNIAFLTIVEDPLDTRKDQTSKQKQGYHAWQDRALMKSSHVETATHVHIIISSTDWTLFRPQSDSYNDKVILYPRKIV